MRSERCAMRIARREIGEPMNEAHPSRPAGTRWDPGQYHKFTDHRLRPALELLDRVPDRRGVPRL